MQCGGPPTCGEGSCLLRLHLQASPSGAADLDKTKTFTEEGNAVSEASARAEKVHRGGPTLAPPGGGEEQGCARGPQDTCQAVLWLL